MPSTTALAISPERTFLRRLVTGLTAAGGDVTGVDSFKEAYRHLTDSRVVFYHAMSLPDENILKLANVLKGGRRLVLLVPRPGIGDLIVPLGLDQVSAVLSVGAADAATLAGVASRNFFGNIFGLERYVPYGVRVQSALIRTYHHKTVAMSTLANFVKHMNIRRKYLENIERVADELLMNALYDAPLVAAQLGVTEGAPNPDGTGDQVVMQYASDGEMFAMGVTDYYGALQKETLIEYVSRCLTSAKPLSQPEVGSGAGLGLYLVSNSVSQLIVNVSPGVATEVIALFNLKAPKIRLTHLSFNTERADASRIPTLAGRQRSSTAMAANGSRSSTPLSIKLTLIAAVLVLFAAGALLAWNRLNPEPSRGDLVVKTHPPGADITVNGTARGVTTPRGLLVPNLGAGRHTIVARKRGFRLHDPVVATVRARHRTPVVIRLERLPSAMKILSSPPGASLYVNGALRGKTPFTLKNLEPGGSLRLRLALQGYQPVERKVKAPAPGVTDAEVFQLQLSPDWGHLYVKANVDVKSVSLDKRNLGLSLPIKGFRVPVGEHVLVLRSRWPYLKYRHPFTVAKAGEDVRISLTFGRIRRVGGEDTRIYWDGVYRKHDFLVPVGQYVFKVKDLKSGQAKRRRITVRGDLVNYVRF